MRLRLRSRLQGHRDLKLAAVILAGLASLFGPALLGLCMVFLGKPLGALIGFSSNLPILVPTVGLMLLYSPLFSWAGMLVGAPLSVLAMSRGWAGPGTAIIGGASIGWLISLGFDGVVLLPITGAICAACYWLLIRALCPMAVAPRQAP